MTKILKQIFASALTAVCLTVTAFAHINMDENGVINVSGELGQAYAGKMVSLDVYRGLDETGEKLSELSPNEYLSYIVCHTQVMTDSNGDYEFSFKVQGGSGFLTVKVAAEGDMNPITESGFYYVDAEEYEEAVRVFNTADTADKMLACLNDYASCLGFSTDEYNALTSKRGCAEILSSMRLLCGEDKAKREEIFNTAVYIQKLNESRIENIFADNSYAKLDETSVKDLYQAEFITDSFKKDMTRRMSGENIKTYTDYKNAVTKAFVMSTVKYPNGYDNIKTVLYALSTETGISESLITTANCKKVAGMDLNSYESLENALKKEETTSSGGGGGGGGGGSSSKDDKKTLITVDAEIAQQESVKEMNRDLFSDLGSVEWAKDAIVALAEKGVVNGKENGKFFPQDNITREEFVKIIVEAFGLESNGVSCGFSDVSSSAWYYEYVNIAVANGIINGVDGKDFGAGRNITREDIATIIYRIAKNQGLFGASDEKALFNDDANIADYAREAVYALKENEIISGNGNGGFMPKAYASRAEAAKIVYGLISIQ